MFVTCSNVLRCSVMWLMAVMGGPCLVVSGSIGMYRSCLCVCYCVLQVLVDAGGVWWCTVVGGDEW